MPPKPSTEVSRALARAQALEKEINRTLEIAKSLEKEITTHDDLIDAYTFPHKIRFR